MLSKCRLHRLIPPSAPPPPPLFLFSYKVDSVKYTRCDQVIISVGLVLFWLDFQPFKGVQFISPSRCVRYTDSKKPWRKLCTIIQCGALCRWHICSLIHCIQLNGCWLTSPASQSRISCSRSPAGYQDLSRHHDWPLKMSLFDWSIRLKGNSIRMPVICWDHLGSRTMLSALICRQY